jgi:hypothetical protein
MSNTISPAVAKANVSEIHAGIVNHVGVTLERDPAGVSSPI